MSKQTILVLAITVIVIIFVIISFCLSPFSKGELEGVFDSASITVGNQNLNVLVAETDCEHTMGLSDMTLDKLDADGMLFMFDDSKERFFWMKDMQFPLDIVWIARGEVVKVEANIQAFDEYGSVVRMNSKPYLVDAVLELPAGGIDKYEIDVGEICVY